MSGDVGQGKFCVLQQEARLVDFFFLYIVYNAQAGFLLKAHGKAAAAEAAVRGQILHSEVIVEMNGMWDLDAALGRTPKVLQVYQIITTVNAQTFELYAANMGQRMLQHITDADMVIFNRATDKTRQLIRDRNVRSMNPQGALYFENEDGTSEDYGAGMPPPYDMEAPVIEIKDPWFGIFYLDASENPEAYDGKTVRFKGQIYRGRNIGKDEFVPGRMAMVCCAEDVRFVGFIAKTENGAPLPKEKSWQTVTALVRAEERREYKGLGPVLYVQQMEETTPPEEEVVNFNR